MLLEQDRRLDQLQTYIDDVPKLLADCKQTVPNQIAKLKDGYREMTEKGYKLEHIQIEKELDTLTNQLKRAENALLEELDVDEASAILQLIDETIQSMYDQLEGEVEAGQSVLSKMPELIIAYEKLEEEKTAQNRNGARQGKLSADGGRNRQTACLRKTAGNDRPAP